MGDGGGGGGNKGGMSPAGKGVLSGVLIIGSVATGAYVLARKGRRSTTVAW